MRSARRRQPGRRRWTTSLSRRSSRSRSVSSVSACAYPSVRVRSIELGIPLGRVEQLRRCGRASSLIPTILRSPSRDRQGPGGPSSACDGPRATGGDGTMRRCGGVSSSIVLALALAPLARAVAAADAARSGARRARAAARRRRRRSRSTCASGTAALRAERRRVARPGVEREAARHLRGARSSSGPATGSAPRCSRTRPPGRPTLARQRLPEGVRRPDAHLARARAARRAAQDGGHRARSTGGWSATSRGSTRGARRPAGSRPSSSSSRRRSPRSSSTTACTTITSRSTRRSPPPDAFSSCCVRGASSPGRASVGRAPAGAYALAQVESAALSPTCSRDGPRQRQLHGRARC